MAAEPDTERTDSIPHPLASARSSVASSPANTVSPLNALGEDVRGEAAPHLAFLSELADQLGLIDPVEAYYEPLVGRWSDLQDEAERLRRAARTAGTVSSELADRLGRLDASWSGRDADGFVDYIEQIGVAGGDVEDALNVLAGALDELVSAMGHILTDLVELLVDTAELTSESALLPTGGMRRARSQLSEAQDAAKALYEAARDVLEAFARLCDGVEDQDAASRSIAVTHRYPQDRFTLHDDVGDQAETAGSGASGASGASDDDQSTTPSSAHEPSEGRRTGVDEQVGDALAPEPVAPPAVAGHVEGTTQTGMGMPLMPMGMGVMGGGGGGGSRQSKTRTTTKPVELFGEPERVVPPVIGEDDSPAEAKPKPQPPK